MKRLFILAEGQTEEKFVKSVLSPYLETKAIYCTPILSTTKRVKKGSNFRGGVTSYQKVKNDIKKLFKNKEAFVSTLIDYYGFSSLVEDIANAGKNCFESVCMLEQFLKRDIYNNPHFIPYLQLHEFEAMVFVSPEVTARTLNEGEKEMEVKKIKDQFHSPEEIDNHPQTAPSKRLNRLFPAYQKNVHGPLITERIGLEKIRNECSHFNDWVSKLENL